MSWETRNGRGHYYTRSVRREGRVVREYLGTGLLGECWADIDDFERYQRAAGQARLRLEREDSDWLERLLVTYQRAIEKSARDALTAAGYRQHQRGAWRKTRVQA